MNLLQRGPFIISHLVKFCFASPYRILGVNPASSRAQIKEAYYRLAQQYHPDRNSSESAKKKFQEVSEAYERLCSRKEENDSWEEERNEEEYESNGPRRRGQKSSKRKEDFDFENFDKFFRLRSGRPGRLRRRGENIKMRVTVSLREAIFGAMKVMSVSRLVVCDVCGGTRGVGRYRQYKCNVCDGQGWVSFRDQNSQIDIKCTSCKGLGKVVKNKCDKCHGHGLILLTSDENILVPKSTNQGQILKIQCLGNASIDGGKYGDLLLKVNILEDPCFKKEGSNILSNLSLTISEAVLGARKTIPTIWGDTEVDIPPALSPKSRVNIPRKGVPGSGNNSKIGDHIVVLDLKVPSELDEETRRIFEQIQKFEN